MGNAHWQLRADIIRALVRVVHGPKFILRKEKTYTEREQATTYLDESLLIHRPSKEYLHIHT
jgi:hypothetical protein